MLDQQGYSAPQSYGASDYMNAEVIQQQRVENVISQINPENLLVDIEHRLRKMRKDHYSNKWVPIVPNQKEVSPLLISNMISILSGYLTNNVTFSNYTEREINNIMKLLIRDILYDLSSNAKVYGIENDYPERNRITEIICISVFSCLKRSLKGTESSKFWKSLSISGDIDSSSPQQRKKGFFDYLKTI